MKPAKPVDMAASVRARLLTRAQARGEDFQLTLVRYAIERLLYRLSKSPHKEAFVLKGAMLFTLWSHEPFRATGDLDLLGFGAPAGERLKSVFRDLAALAVEPDGIEYDMKGLRAEEMHAQEEYKGLRLSFLARIGNVRIPMKVDVGFGDVVTPGPINLAYPTMLDLPAANVRAYPPATVVAEKFQAMVELGIRNSRMKDFFDLWAIASTLDLDGSALAAALAATFARRQTELPATRPLALSAEFVEDGAKQAQWAAFRRRTVTTLAPATLQQTVDVIADLVMPAATGDCVGRTWRAGGPWS
ncbi:MAG: nucleotidyl transferase AbiEii/AbiGii toxin family protein [Vitreimonas sp.]